MTTDQGRAGFVLGVVQRLSELITRENELLLERRIPEMGAQQEEKARLSEAYERELKAARANPAWLGAMQPPEKDRLRAATERLNEILDQHRRLVFAAKTVTERMLKAIGDEVAKRQRPLKGYGKDAMMSVGPGVYAAPAVSVALDRFV